MPTQYIGTKLILASPADQDGKEGYDVWYEDGYRSWSPKDVFEKAYRPTDNMNFGLAIEAMKIGKRVARSGWNGKDMWLALQKPDVNSKMSLPYIYMKPVTDDFVPWLASQTDMLADDWFIVPA